jgi:type IV pilus assembly protein PilV
MLKLAMTASLRSRRDRGPRRLMAGFTLIEVLIAILIFSIGVLGLVGLQASLVRAQANSKMRSDAAYLATDLVSQMWADARNLESYSNCASYAPCEAWRNKVGQILPQGAPTVAVNAGTGVVTLTINWQPPNEVVHTFATSTSINPNPPPTP